MLFVEFVISLILFRFSVVNSSILRSLSFPLITSRGQFHHCTWSNSAIVFSSKRFLIGLAGTPTTTVYGSTSLVTTAPAPIIAQSPT